MSEPLGTALEEPPDRNGAFPRLGEEQRARLRAADGRTVIVATGAQYRKLDLPELERYEGVGVYYAATSTEAQMCESDPVVIVGGGNSAGQAAMFLSRHAAHVRLMIRGDDLGKSMSRYLIDEIERRPQIEVMTDSEITVAVRLVHQHLSAR